MKIKNTGFTVVETLVCIAVSAIIISLLQILWFSFVTQAKHGTTVVENTVEAWRLFDVIRRDLSLCRDYKTEKSVLSVNKINEYSGNNSLSGWLTLAIYNENGVSEVTYHLRRKSENNLTIEREERANGLLKSMRFCEGKVKKINFREVVRNDNNLPGKYGNTYNLILEIVIQNMKKTDSDKPIEIRTVFSPSQCWDNTWNRWLPLK